MTIKLQEALQAAQGLATKSAHPELKSGHVLLALLQQEGGVVVPIMQKAGVDVTRLKAAVMAGLDKEPRQQGASSHPQLSYELRSTFDAADEQTTREFMKATDIKGFEAVVNSFKANVLATITGERSKKAMVRGRMFEKVGSVINVVHQGMQQELASLLVAGRRLDGLMDI